MYKSVTFVLPWYVYLTYAFSSLLHPYQYPGVVLLKKVFLKISQNSQEKTCAKASFLIKLPKACNFIKKGGTDTGVFLWILRKL